MISDMLFSFFTLLICVAAHVPISHHTLATPHDKNVFLIGEISNDHWYQAGPAPIGTGIPPKPYDDKWALKETTILVEIASYRETKCGESMYKLLTKAKFPKRILFAVVQQNKPEDEDCLQSMCELFGAPFKAKACPHYKQVLMNRLDESEAKGPVYARALANQMVDLSKHNFCMQVDAHVDAVQDWDVEILKEWAAARNEFAVLTTYPVTPENMGTHIGIIPHVCRANFWMDRVCNLQARSASNLESPALAPLWCAGLAFSRCHADVRVPTDPELKQVFAGEEFARGSRLWTSGYDFYSPSRPIIGCLYGDKKGGHLDERKVNEEEEKTAYERMSSLLRFPDSDQSAEAWRNIGKYGMGTQRTLEQYLEFSGVDTTNREMGELDSRCISYYIPWNDTDVKREILLEEFSDHDSTSYGAIWLMVFLMVIFLGIAAKIIVEQISPSSKQA